MRPGFRIIFNELNDDIIDFLMIHGAIITRKIAHRTYIKMPDTVECYYTQILDDTCVVMFRHEDKHVGFMLLLAFPNNIKWHTLSLN